MWLVREIKKLGGNILLSKLYKPFLVIAIYEDSDNTFLIEAYAYDHEGIRVKTYNAIKNETTYTPFKEFMQIRNSTGTYNFTYVYENDVLVAKINPDGSKHFYHPDHLGSTSLITDEVGGVVEDVWYYPYGKPGVSESNERRLYEGQEYSEDIGEYDYNFRNYENTIQGPFEGAKGGTDALIYLSQGEDNAFGVTQEQAVQGGTKATIEFGRFALLGFSAGGSKVASDISNLDSFISFMDSLFSNLNNGEVSND